VDTALYYTFSTIAQALAAGMALLAAIALYRLGSIDAECRGAAEMVDHWLGGRLEIKQYYYVSEWAKFLEATAPIAATPDRDNVRSQIEAACNRIRSLINVIAGVRSALWTSLALTASTVFASILVLAFVPMIREGGGFAVPVLALGVVASAACLISYWVLVRRFLPTAGTVP
jgi:hypothetical protein